MAYDDGYGRPQVQLQFSPFQGWIKKLVLINGGIFLGLFFLGFFGQGAQGAVEQFLALDPPAWWGGFPPLWQPFTYGWLHSLRTPGTSSGTCCSSTSSGRWCSPRWGTGASSRTT